MKKVIEITGPAGVGKSFLCNNLCSNLDVIQQKRPPIFSLPFIRSLSIIPSLFFLKRGRLHIYIKFLINLGKWTIINNKKQGIYIIDEGPWHFLCGSLLPRAIDKKKQTFLKHWKFYVNLPDIIVYLKADPDFIKNRRIMRNREKEKTLVAREIKDAINEFESSLYFLKSLYPQVELITYKIEDNTSIDQITDSIYKTIENNIKKSQLHNEINIHI